MEADTDLAALAASLLRHVETVSASPRTLTGRDILRVPGPDGTWRVRMEWNKRGWWTMSIHAPKVVDHTCYSAHGLREFLEKTYGVTSRDLDIGVLPERAADDFSPTPSASLNIESMQDEQETVPTLSSDVADAFVPSFDLDWAAHRIQMSFRAHLFRKAVRNKIMSEAHFKAAEIRRRDSVVMVSKTHRMFVDSDTSDIATIIREMHHNEDQVASTCAQHLNTCVPQKASLGDVATQTFVLTRSHYATLAEQTMRDYSNSSNEYMCAKSIVRSPNYPLIVGTLPTPTGSRQLRSGHLLVCTGNVLSDLHMTCLKRRFGKTWHRHVADMIVERQMGVYDLYTSTTRETHLASMVVSKFMVRREGRLSAAVHIESIVSPKTGGGGGGILLDVCKKMLFVDAHNVDDGYIFAQCLSVPFWKFQLDLTMDAKAFVYQVSILVRSYHLDPACDMRSCHVLKRHIDTMGKVVPSSPHAP